MSKVWFITGSASGLGRNIAEAVSRIGRSPRRNSPRSRSLGRSRKLVQENSDYSAGGEADTSGAYRLRMFIRVNMRPRKFGRPREVTEEEKRSNDQTNST